MLKLDNIHTYYGNIHAIKGLTLEVKQGEIVTLIGSNGAGKSTTLMSISGITRPKTGKIFFQDTEITSALTDQIVSMGITQVPEGRMIFPRLTVYENLLMGAYLRKDRKGIKLDEERSFELFPILKERRKQTGGTLSGGEQQMLAIAMALMARPRLLLLDEPSMGLAPMIIKEIFQRVADLQAERKLTVLLIEQNARAALRIADRGYVIETGKIVLEEEAGELLANQEVKRAYLGKDQREIWE